MRETNYARSDARLMEGEQPASGEEVQDSVRPPFGNIGPLQMLFSRTNSNLQTCRTFKRLPGFPCSEKVLVPYKSNQNILEPNFHIFRPFFPWSSQRTMFFFKVSIQRTAKSVNSPANNEILIYI